MAGWRHHHHHHAGMAGVEAASSSLDIIGVSQSASAVVYTATEMETTTVSQTVNSSGSINPEYNPSVSRKNKLMRKKTALKRHLEAIKKSEENKTKKPALTPSTMALAPTLATVPAPALVTISSSTAASSTAAAAAAAPTSPTITSTTPLPPVKVSSAATSGRVIENHYNDMLNDDDSDKFDQEISFMLNFDPEMVNPEMVTETLQHSAIEEQEEVEVEKGSHQDENENSTTISYDETGRREGDMKIAPASICAQHVPLTFSEISAFQQRAEVYNKKVLPILETSSIEPKKGKVTMSYRKFIRSPLNNPDNKKNTTSIWLQNITITVNKFSNAIEFIYLNGNERLFSTEKFRISPAQWYTIENIIKLHAHVMSDWNYKDGNIEITISNNDIGNNKTLTITIDENCFKVYFAHQQHLQEDIHDAGQIIRLHANVYFVQQVVEREIHSWSNSCRCTNKSILRDVITRAYYSTGLSPIPSIGKGLQSLNLGNFGIVFEC